jgi:hypothetical protein
MNETPRDGYEMFILYQVTFEIFLLFSLFQKGGISDFKNDLVLLPDSESLNRGLCRVGYSVGKKNSPAIIHCWVRKKEETK